MLKAGLVANKQVTNEQNSCSVKTWRRLSCCHLDEALIPLFEIKQISTYESALLVSCVLFSSGISCFSNTETAQVDMICM